MDAAKVAAEETETAQLELELDEFSKDVDQIISELTEDKEAQKFIQDVQSGKIKVDQLDDPQQQKIKNILAKFSPLEGKYEQLKNDLISGDPNLQKKFGETEANYKQISDNLAPLKALIQTDQTINKEIKATKAAAEKTALQPENKNPKQPEMQSQAATSNPSKKAPTADQAQPADQIQTLQPESQPPAASDKTGLFSGIWGGFKDILGKGKDAVKGFFKFLFKDLPRAIFTGKTEK